MSNKKTGNQNKLSSSVENFSNDSPKRVARGQDMYGYGEQKKKLNLTLTPTTIALISDLAKQLELSRSETIEQLFRRHYESLVTLLTQAK